jgi:hypothetical protein
VLFPPWQRGQISPPTKPTYRSSWQLRRCFQNGYFPKHIHRAHQPRGSRRKTHRKQKSTRAAFLLYVQNTPNCFVRILGQYNHCCGLSIRAIFSSIVRQISLQWHTRPHLYFSRNLPSTNSSPSTQFKPQHLAWWALGQVTAWRHHTAHDLWCTLWLLTGRFLVTFPCQLSLLDCNGHQLPPTVSPWVCWSETYIAI